jgi:uncharacterized protein YkwD
MIRRLSNPLFALFVAFAVPAAAQDAAQEFAARNQFNLRRAQVGLAPLAQHAQLTSAARGHGNWLVLNNQSGHSESPSLPLGFYGEFFSGRLANAGYAPLLSGAEVISVGPGGGAEAVESLMQAIYHRFGIFRTSVDEQGVAFATGHPGFGSVLVANFATRSSPLPAPSAGWLGVYPHAGQAGVPIDFYSDEESPDPASGSNRIGYPVSVQVEDIRDLIVQSFTLNGPGGQAVASVLLSGSPNASVQDANTPASAAAILPLAPLAYGTTYTASFTGMSNGVPVARMWTFTTVQPAITLAPSSVWVAPGGQAIVKLSGGNGRYSTQWTYSGASSPIGVSFLGSETLVVSGIAPGEADLEIRDADGHSASVPVAVNSGAVSVPDAFAYPPRAGVPPGTVAVSALMPITGINVPVAVSIAGGEYSINGGAYTSVPGTLEPGERLGVRSQAPSGFGIQGGALVTVGGVSAQFVVTTHAAGEASLLPALVTGWNLLGNGFFATLDPAESFGHADLPIPGVSSLVESVWRWNAAAQKWQFFSPLLTPAQSAQYAANHGLEDLTAIAPGSGYWVYAYAPITLPPQSGVPVTYGAPAFSALPRGWNLIAVGAPIAPPVFNSSVGAALVNFESLWTWDSAQSKWVFYSPVLEALPGGAANILAYALQHNLLEFSAEGKQLESGVGFWVYRP